MVSIFRRANKLIYEKSVGISLEDEYDFPLDCIRGGRDKERCLRFRVVYQQL